MRLDPIIQKALDGSGKPWEITKGKKHYQLRINHKLVGVLPMGAKTRDLTRARKNTLAQIKRAVMENDDDKN